jgi:hypothetical protein
MSAFIRTKEGKPITSDFASGEGTPIVIDVLTGIAYYLFKNTPLPIIGGTFVSFNAFSEGFSDGFANGS